jgi:tripartite-type tricarboxylate transporter receptor subunit TctC
VLAGRVDVMVETMTLALPHIKSGKLRGLAVTSPERKDYLPEVPSASETLPGFVFQSWLGIATTAGTPPAVVAKLNDSLGKVLAEPEVQKRLSALGGGAAPISPGQMKQQVVTEITRWKTLVESRKLERN